MPLQPPDLSVPMRLDLTNACLWRGVQRIALRPKTLAVLQCLLAHPGQLVTKATLLDAVWPETTVNDVALMICIRELRQALGDNPKAPRFIETMHRRGYRFVGDLPVTAPPSCSLPAVVSSAIPPVGRQEELTRLHAWLASARRGIRQMIFVTGEAGLGKTTLVEAFVAAIGNHGPLWIGHGQCVEHYGAGEAYLPVLEALGRLCRGPDGKELVALLGQQAPTWLVQIPGLLRAADLETLRRRSAGTTRERMLRELAEALDLLTARQPLVLVLEDLHWSDPSTLDLLAVLARRREAARLLLIGTYRPPEVLRRTPHPLHTIKHELQLHGHCAELPLTLLTEDAMAAYLARRLPGLHGVERLARLMHQRTEGNPLFMVTLVESWLTQGVLLEQDGASALPVGVEALQAMVPDSLRQMIDMQHRMGQSLFWLGELSAARTHLEQTMALDDPRQHPTTLSMGGMRPINFTRNLAASALWLLGYPEQAIQRSQEALTLAKEWNRLVDVASALNWAAWLHQYRREGPRAQEQAEASITLAIEHGFAARQALGTIMLGGALAMQGQGEAGIAHLRQGLAAWRAVGSEVGWTNYLTFLAEAYGHVGQAAAGLHVLTEALAFAHTTGERMWEAELYRLKGELLLQSQSQGPESEVLTSDTRLQTQDAEAEACFHQALDIACRQQARSLELRAAMSLSRLWMPKGKHAAIRELLVPIYNWFTEGFDTADLQEARALLEALS